MKSIFTLGVALTVLAGCTVGPNYRRPELSIREKWSAPSSDPDEKETVNLSAWWKQFNDSQLDSLIARAAAYNLDLKIAQARVRESRARYGIVESGLWPTVNVSGDYARVGTSHHQPVLGSIP